MMFGHSSSNDGHRRNFHLINHNLLILLQFYAEDVEEAELRSKVSLIVPNGSCGGIIGKGGSIIKPFIEDSQANIKISPQENSYIGFNDRLVTVIGTLEQQVQAINLILSRLSEDLHYVQYVGPPFPLPEDIGNSLTLGVADEHVRIVVERSGRNIAEISQISGARIKISEKGDFIHRTSDRKVTIVGSQRAISVAEALIVQKVATLSAPPPASTPES